MDMRRMPLRLMVSQTLCATRCTVYCWPQKDSMPLYKAIVENSKGYSKAVNGKDFFVLPTWYPPFRNNVSVHPLDDAAERSLQAGRI